MQPMVHGSDKSIISAPVGQRAPNIPHDVRVIAHLLNVIAQGPFSPLPEDGQCHQKIIDRIKFVQLSLVRMPIPDGLIHPQGPTISAIIRSAAALIEAKKTAGMLKPPSSLQVSTSRDASEKKIPAANAGVMTNDLKVTKLLTPGAGQNGEPSDADY
jgi:hypothetical protein